MKRETLILSLLIVWMPAIGLAQPPRETAMPPVIVVSGNAQVEATPDAATVRLGVVRQEATAQAAQEQTNRAVQAILTEIVKLGVPAQKIQTSRLTLTPVYATQRPDNREAPRIAAYSAANTVAIDLDNLAQIGPVIDAGLRAGANQLEGVRFRLKNDLPVREQALKLAASEARQKAETLAAALNVRLINVLEATEGGVSVLARNDTAEHFVLAARAQDTPTPVSPGQLEVSASVTIKYLIAPR